MNALLAAPADPTPMHGIALKIASVIVFLTMFACIKRTAAHVPTGEAVFFRSFFALPVILGWLWLRGGSAQALVKGLATTNPFGHLWRGLAGTGAMGLGFLGVGLLPLSEAVAIGYAAPLLVTVFAALFLGERIRAYRIGAVLLGLLGVLLVLAPRLGEGAGPGEVDARSLQTLGALACLGAAVSSAFAQVFARRLVHAESISSIVFWFSVSSTVLALLTLPFGWVLPSPQETGLLIAAGLFGGFGQILLTSSYRHAELAVIAPFEYTSMLFALLIGYLAFGEVPTAPVLAGAALVIVAGLLIVYRERQLGIERRKARAVVPPQG